MTDKNPSDLARETLRLLAGRKLLPTPENYSSIYREISGAAEPSNPVILALTQSLAQASWIEPKTRRECSRLASQDSWDDIFALIFQSAQKAIQPRAEVHNATAQASSDGYPSSRAALLDDLREQIARMAEFAWPALGEDDAKIGPDVAAFAQFCRAPAESGSITQLKARMASFNHRLSFVAEDQSEIRKSLLGMLRMVFENIAELTTDDAWLRGQIELLMQASAPPLALRRLDDVQRRLKDVIFKQSEIKRQHILAQDEMKHLLATFLEKLSFMSDLTSAHQRRIEQCAKQVESAKDLASIGPAINEAISATRALSHEATRTRAELATLKGQAESSAQEVKRLRLELDSVSTQARHDTLTGALNRKGLDEAFAREISRSRRQASHLSLALLDLDNFKTINDIHGHPVGDAALAHLAQVAREAMRPQDTLSRFGGEEFVILLPDTNLDGAMVAMVRLQRELTRRFFMAGSHKLLITFSAGVAELGPDESALSAISRADQGMYQAKRAGKNKVVSV
jgi:diguanylate cyclase